jgi:hypothetical protein
VPHLWPPSPREAQEVRSGAASAQPRGPHTSQRQRSAVPVWSRCGRRVNVVDISVADQSATSARLRLRVRLPWRSFASADAASAAEAGSMLGLGGEGSPA